MILRLSSSSLRYDVNNVICKQWWYKNWVTRAFKSSSHQIIVAVTVSTRKRFFMGNSIFHSAFLPFSVTARHKTCFIRQIVECVEMWHILYLLHEILSLFLINSFRCAEHFCERFPCPFLIVCQKNLWKRRKKNSNLKFWSNIKKHQNKLFFSSHHSFMFLSLFIFNQSKFEYKKYKTQYWTFDHGSKCRRFS